MTADEVARAVPAPQPAPAFAHASEAELARILDFYAVHWEYEPHTFPILWSLDGTVVESFTPDFFLPDLDLYVELTTLKQKLVRKKNRKLRRLRELYPDVRIKLFYARDFRMLLLKFGRHDLFEAISGTVGQVALPHGAPIAAMDAPAPEPSLDLAGVIPPGPPGGAEPPTPGRLGRGARRRRRPRRAVPATLTPPTFGEGRIA